MNFNFFKIFNKKRIILFAIILMVFSCQEEFTEVTLPDSQETIVENFPCKAVLLFSDHFLFHLVLYRNAVLPCHFATFPSPYGKLLRNMCENYVIAPGSAAVMWRTIRFHLSRSLLYLHAVLLCHFVTVALYASQFSMLSLATGRDGSHKIEHTTLRTIS